MNSYFQSTIRNQQSPFCKKQRTPSAYRKKQRTPSRCLGTDAAYCKKQRTPLAYRKYIAYTIFLLISFFFCVYPTQAATAASAAEEEGYVVTTGNGQIYLNLGKKHGIEEGMLFSVYRPLFNVYRPKENATVNIAKIKVTQVHSETSVASILSPKSDMEIRAGDRIELIQPDEEIQPDEKSDDQLAPPKKKKSKKKRIHGLFLKAGIVVLGGAGYFHQSADKAYSKYQTANSSTEALSYRKKTELNDKRTKIALGVSLALISISAYLWE